MTDYYATQKFALKKLVRRKKGKHEHGAKVL